MTITTLMACCPGNWPRTAASKMNQRNVDLAYDCVHTHTHESGYMGYRFATGAYSPVGRQGLAIIVHRVAQEKGAEEHVRRVTSGLAKAKTRLNDGHGDNVLAVLVGTARHPVVRRQGRHPRDVRLQQGLHQHGAHPRWRVRRPARAQRGEKGYYLSPRIHPTAAMVLVLGMSHPSLRIQGKLK